MNEPASCANRIRCIDVGCFIRCGQHFAPTAAAQSRQKWEYQIAARQVAEQGDQAGPG